MRKVIGYNGQQIRWFERTLWPDGGSLLVQEYAVVQIFSEIENELTRVMSRG